MKAYRGDVIYARSHPADTPTSVYVGEKDHLSKKRPLVVVSNDKGNESGSVVLAVPMTTKIKAMHLPTHCLVGYHDSMVMCEQIYTIDQSDIESISWRLSYKDMEKIEHCLRAALGMGRL